MMTRNKYLGGIRILTAPICFLAAAALTTSGCDDSGTMQTAAATTDPGGCLGLDNVSYLSGATATSCCANGNAISPPPTGCPAPVGVAAVADSLSNGAAATTAGDGGTTTAAQLASSSTTGETTGATQTPGSSAALAGGVLRSASLNDGPLGASGSVPIAALNSLGSSSGYGNSNGTGSGNGAGGGTSGLSTNGGTGVSTAGGLTGAGSGSGALGSGLGSAIGASAATYGSGAGGGMSAGMYGANSNGGVDGPNGSAQTGHSVDQFAKGRGLAGEIPVMGTADPSDYFKRLGIQDNLFKIVERRYIAKSKQWALVDAAVITQAASKTIRQQH